MPLSLRDMNKTQYFQDYMPGNICFGCGTHNAKGLHIRSFWDGEIAACLWHPQPHHEGWAALTCGGIIATIVDCHCIATAMATAVKNESRALDSEPHYLFATGSMNITYLKPTPIDAALRLEAQVKQIKNERKYTIACHVLADGDKTATADVVVLLVYRSDKPEQAPKIFHPSP